MEIVQPGQDTGRQLVSGPATRWLPADGINFPIDKLAGGDVGHVGGSIALTDADRVLGTVGGAEAYETPISRAKGQVIRLLPFSLLWLVLSVGVVLLLGLAWPWLLLAFAVLTVASYVKMNGQEFAHSRNGVERHRIDAAADLAEMQLQQNFQLKRMALETYLEIAKAQYLEGTDDSDSR